MSRGLSINPYDIGQQVDEYRRKKLESGGTIEDVDIQSFLENHLKIIDTGGNRVDLILNRAQEKLHLDCCDQLETRGLVRTVVGKIRQTGASTYVEGRYFAMVYLFNFITALVAAHIWKSTAWIFGMSKFYYRNLPKDMQAARPLMWPEPTKEMLEFKHGSKLIAQTAGTADFGHGMTIQLAHLPEAARYPNPIDFMTGLGNAQHFVPGTERIIESTGDGEDELFYPTFKAAQDGENEYRALFLGLKEFAFYSIPPECIGKPKEQWRPDEIQYQADYEVPDSIMDFVIWKKRSADCGDSWPIFKSQFPATEDHMFSETGDLVFSRDAMNKMALGLMQPLRKVDLEFEEDEPGSFVVPREDGLLPLWEIYEEPREDAQYILTADIAEGVGGAYSVVNVWRIEGPLDLGKVVLYQAAHYYTNYVETLLVGVHIFMAGTWYGEAFVTVENNNHGLLIVKNLQHGFGSHRQTLGGYPFVYYPVEQKTRDGQERDRLGWRTDGTTRPMLMQDLVWFVHDGRLIVRSQRTYEELRGFYWDAKSKEWRPRHKHPDAPRATDDEVISAGIAPQAFKEYIKNPSLLPRAKTVKI